LHLDKHNKLEKQDKQEEQLNNDKHDKHRFLNKNCGKLQATGCSLSLEFEKLNYPTQAELPVNVEIDS